MDYEYALDALAISSVYSIVSFDEFSLSNLTILLMDQSPIL
jgi:hypothetical protein